jgi:hypothetical protein
MSRLVSLNPSLRIIYHGSQGLLFLRRLQIGMGMRIAVGGTYHPRG